MLLLLLFASCYLLQGTISSPLSRTTIASPKSSSEDYLLPTDNIPNHYTIELEPDFENDVFNGSVSIEFTVINTTRYFYFHRRELVIDASSFNIESGNGIPVSIGSFSCDSDDREICTITFTDELIAGNDYTLTINSFTGILNNANAGFYLAKYEDEEGNEV